ncbi:hydroxyacid dehydrogenase [Actinospica durhamensis]|uniref:Hydroxyacid dehydrogenase n=1 Tax=Actinospica durhamensis TaxID=1508375 RepID=A0A941EIU6_9ACTN|nr:NAD(P)-dependent oxidoreductase [Actinospica durhamensis]MBR7833315.1 hydroxyacid dehydrogenase [Actinospica durhamensis]
MTPWRVLSLLELPADRVEPLFERLPVTVTAPARLDTDAAAAAAAEADLILGGWSGAVPVGPQLLRAAPKTAAVIQASVGVDTVDVSEATARGIPVANAAGFNTQSVAEWCVGAAISALRLFVAADDKVREGGWPQPELVRRGSRELCGLRVGIVGFGAVGQACARLFSAFGCELAQWSRTRRDTVPWLELPDLVARSDVLVVALPLVDDTRGLLSGDLLGRLPQDAVLVNVGRGGIVDEEALARMVRDGGLAAAAFDVFQTEPLPADSPLLRDRRILLHPHAAGTTRQSRDRLLAGIRAAVERVVRGEPLEHVVNGVDPLVRRR